MLAYIVIVAAAYFLGSIPTGYVVARVKGIDIRTVGSGNIGATNVFRILGKPAGIFVLAVDGLKGYAACAWLCDALLPSLGVAGADTELYRILAGMAAVLGHNYTCWLKFKGGKGIATSAGVYFALAPLAAGIAVTAFVLAVLLTRYVSVGSISAAIALAAAIWCLPNINLVLRILTTAIALMAIYKHRSNIKRLMTGTESRLGKRPEVQEGVK